MINTSLFPEFVAEYQVATAAYDAYGPEAAALIETAPAGGFNVWLTPYGGYVTRTMTGHIAQCGDHDPFPAWCATEDGARVLADELCREWAGKVLDDDPKAGKTLCIFESDETYVIVETPYQATETTR